jgi:hypothetical protein
LDISLIRRERERERENPAPQLDMEIWAAAHALMAIWGFGQSAARQIINYHSGRRKGNSKIFPSSSFDPYLTICHNEGKSKNLNSMGSYVNDAIDHLPP